MGLGAAQLDIASGPYWQANFLPYFQSDPANRCSFRRVGACEVTDCRASVYGDAPTLWSSAGPVTFATTGTSDVVLEPNSQFVYASASAAAVKWSPLDAISVSAPGAELEGFDVDLVMPSPLDMLTPDLETAANDEITIVRSAALALSWTPSEHTVLVEVYEGASTPSGAPDSFDIACLFDGSEGSGEVPAALMAELEGGRPASILAAVNMAYVEVSLGNRELRASAFNGSSRYVVIE